MADHFHGRALRDLEETQKVEVLVLSSENAEFRQEKLIPFQAWSRHWDMCGSPLLVRARLLSIATRARSNSEFSETEL